MNPNAHIVVVLSLLFTSCVQTERHDVAQDIELITQLSEGRADAFKDGDAEAIARAFTPDGCLMAPEAEVQFGREAVAAYYQSIFDTFDTDLESHYEEVEVDGDLAFGRGEAKVTLISKTDGDTTYSTSKYLNILRRQEDGSWLTTHDIWNGNASE